MKIVIVGIIVIDAIERSGGAQEYHRIPMVARVGARLARARAPLPATMRSRQERDQRRPAAMRRNRRGHRVCRVSRDGQRQRSRSP